MRRFLMLASLLDFVCAASPAFAWNSRGHMLVGYARSASVSDRAVSEIANEIAADCASLV